MAGNGAVAFAFLCLAAVIVGIGRARVAIAIVIAPAFRSMRLLVFLTSMLLCSVFVSFLLSFLSILANFDGYVHLDGNAVLALRAGLRCWM